MYRLGLLVFEIFGLKVFGGREEYTLKKFRACICFGRKIDSLPCTSVLSSCCRRSVFEKLEKLEFSCRRRLTRLGPGLSIERPAKICPCMPHRYIDFGPKTLTPATGSLLTSSVGKVGRNVNETHWKIWPKC